MTVSPAVRLVEMVRTCAQIRSRQRREQIMGSALYLAVRAGLHFDPSDMSRLQQGMNADRGGYGEHLYAEAVRHGNLTACRSFEEMKGRRPFILDGHRLAVSSSLWRNGRLWRVTSFIDGGRIVICCFKEKKIGEYAPTRVEHITRLTHADFRKAVKSGDFSYRYRRPKSS